MTGQQLKSLIERAGKTQVGLARELEIGERTMRQHIASERVPKLVEYAARHACECRRVRDMRAGSSVNETGER